MSLRSVPALAFVRFIAHDGWAIASHIALSVLMSLFPFLILVTALLVVGLIAYARGPKHYRGDEIGSHGTKVVVVHIVP